jgi:tripartite-type tricarboxylate transporter receptor subunit TctC
MLAAEDRTADDACPARSAGGLAASCERIPACGNPAAARSFAAEHAGRFAKFKAMVLPALGGLVLGIASLANAHAAYPDKPIKVVVGFPPGGPNDLIARLISNKLGERLGQAVIVENRPGVNAEVAAAYVAKAPPDGYTVLFGSSGALTISPNMKADLPYDPVKDFTPLIAVADNPMLLVVAANSPYKSAADVVNAARARPGGLAYASAGTGSPTHLAGALFASMAGLNILHVPYKGGGPAMTDLIGGQVQMYFAGIPTALPLIRGGKLRALAITGPDRSPVAPDVPTVSDTPGLKGYQASIWYGFLAPAGTPAVAVKTFDDAVSKVLADPQVAQQFASEGSRVTDIRGDQFSKMMREETQKWGAIVKQIGLSAKTGK